MVARAFVKAKIQRSLEVLTWLAARYDVERELQAAKREAMKLGRAKTTVELRTVEGHVVLRYWEAFEKVLPQRLGLELVAFPLPESIKCMLYRLCPTHLGMSMPRCSRATL